MTKNCRSMAADAATASLSRRDLLGFAAKGAASVLVSQVVLACARNAGGGASDDQVASGAASPGCVLTAALTDGPFFVDEKLDRSDIRADPGSGVISAGVPLSVTFNVQRVQGSACTPLTGAWLDAWHCDAGGTYSDVSGLGNGPEGAGRKFLRGYQITDAGGVARFQTIYPGWYPGRAVHIHFKLRLIAGSATSYEFSSQLFFDEALTSRVHALAPYSARGTRNVVNSTDGIYNGLTTAEKATLTLQATASGDGYAGAVTLGVAVG